MAIELEGADGRVAEGGPICRPANAGCDPCVGADRINIDISFAKPTFWPTYIGMCGGYPPGTVAW